MADLFLTAVLSLLGDPRDTRPEIPAPDAADSLSSPPVLDWRVRLPGPPVSSASHTELSRPVVRGDEVWLGYAAVSELVRVARSNGDVITRYAANAPIKAAPVVGDDRVWFSDGAGYTWCYPIEGGDPIWTHFGGAPITSTPLEMGGLLVIATVDDVVYALNPDDGMLRWRYQRPSDPGRESELTLYGAASPVQAGSDVLVGFSDGTLVALGQEHGEIAWERHVGEGRYPDLIGTPLVVDNVAFVGGSSEPFLAIDLENLAVLWRVDVGTSSEPAIEGELILHGATDGKLRGIDRRTGDVRWTWDSETTGALSTPQVVEAGVLVSSSDGSIYLINPADGTLVWEYDPGYLLAGITVAPLVVGRQVLAVTNGGDLISLVGVEPVKLPEPVLPGIFY